MRPERPPEVICLPCSVGPSGVDFAYRTEVHPPCIQVVVLSMLEDHVMLARGDHGNRTRSGVGLPLRIFKQSPIHVDRGVE